MASNALTTNSKSGPPLSFMTRLSPVVYHYKPAPSSAPAAADPQAPKLILLASWMGAREPHIAKYVIPYQALYPTAQILLLRFEAHHLAPALPWTRRKYNAQYATALPVLRAVADEIQTAAAWQTPNGWDQEIQKRRKPEVLIHLWSNGGSISLTTVYNLYKKAYKDEEDAQFPPHAIIFDSSPGQFSYTASVKVMAQNLPFLVKLLVVPLFHAVSAWYWFWHVLIGRRIRLLRGWMAHMAEGHNDLRAEFGGRARTEVRRAYIYGPGDDLIPERDVEEHAADARKRGIDVRLERFVGSMHVQHVRLDEERYWRVVRDTWEGSGR